MKKTNNVVMGLLIVVVIVLIINNIILLNKVNKIQTTFSKVFNPIPMGLEAKSKAPEFNLQDVSEQRYTLQMYQGEEVLIVFSSPDCPACEKFWPDIVEFQKKFPLINTVMISKGDEQQLSELAINQNFNFPLLFWDDTVAADYNVPGTPYIYLISENETILFGGFSDSLSEIENYLSSK